MSRENILNNMISSGRLSCSEEEIEDKIQRRLIRLNQMASSSTPEDMYEHQERSGSVSDFIEFNENEMDDHEIRRSENYYYHTGSQMEDEKYEFLEKIKEEDLTQNSEVTTERDGAERELLTQL
jgi:hypothetical protein